MAEVANLRAVIDADTGGFTRGMRSVNSQLDDTARKMNGLDGSVAASSGKWKRWGGGVGKAALVGTAAVAGLGIAAGGVLAIGTYKAVQSASDLNETVSKTKVIFGKSAKDILSWSKTSAGALGQSQRQALDAASTFAVFGKSAGLSGKDLTGFSKELSGLSADLASFYNTDPEEAITAIGAALRGESEPIRRFGVLLDDASLRAEAFKQGIIASTKDALTPQQRALAAHALIMKQTKDAQGDFARTSGGLANQQRIFNAELENAKAAIGQSLLPLATAIMPKITAAIPAVVDGIKSLISAVQGIVGPFVQAQGGVAGFQTKAQTLFSQIRSAAVPVMEALGRTFAVVGQMAATVGPALGRYIGTVLQTIGRIAAVALPIIADGIEQIGPPLARIAARLLTFSTFMVRMFGTVLPPIIRTLAPVFSAVFSTIGAVLTAIAALLEGDFSGAWQAAVKAAQIWFVKLPGIILGILGDLVGMAAGKAAEIGRGIIQGIVSAIKAAPGAIKDALAGVLGGALDFAKGLLGIASPSKVFKDEVGKPIGQGIVAGFLNGTATLPSNISDTVSRALDAAKARVDAKRAPLQAAFQRMAQGIMRAFDAETAAGVKRIQDKLNAAQASVNMDFDAQINSRRKAGDELTPAEAALQAERSAYEQRERERAKAEAQDALARAQAEGNAEAILDAQRRIDQIAYDEKIAALEAQAAEERRLKDEATATDLAKLEEQRQARLAALQTQFGDEQLQYESHREVMRQKREDELARLEANLSRANGSVKSKQAELQRFLNNPDIRKAMANSGTNLGKAFADALEDSKGRVTEAVKALAKVVKDYLKLSSPSKLGPLSTLDTWWKAMPDTLVGSVDTSMIGQVAAGIAEPVLGGGAAPSAGGGVIVNVTVQGSVTAEQDLAETIRRELIKTGQRNGTIFGGLA